MRLIEAKRPESLIDVLAVVLIAPAILWILAVCWVFGGNREARKAYLWMFAKRDSSNPTGQPRTASVRSVAPGCCVSESDRRNP